VCVEQRPSHLREQSTSATTRSTPGRRKLLPDKDAEIVIYCASAKRQNSGIAANRLAALEYTNVRDYHEGKAEWIDAGLPVEGEARPAA
jgi:rhodanese-related sulfurtransferase